MERLEHGPVAPKGLLAASGAWADYKELDLMVVESYRRREQSEDRPVTLDS